MSQNGRLNRRSFLKSAGLTADASATGTAASRADAAAEAAYLSPTGRYDFDTVYDRFGTDCVKFDQQINTATSETGEIDVGGISAAAAGCETRHACNAAE